MAWLEAHQSLATHRKLYGLAEQLGITRPAAAGHLLFLWFWALDNAPDGDFTDVSPTILKDAACWPKKAETLIEALVDARWLDRDGDSLRLHDWMVYAGRLVEKRRSDADRKRSVRGTSIGQPTERRADGARTNQHQPTPTKQTNTSTNQLPAADKLVACVRALDNLTGSLTGTPTVQRQIREWLDGFDVVGVDPAGWFEDACDEAAKQNVRKLAYVLKILERWQAAGSQADTRSSNDRAEPPDPLRAQVEADIARAERGAR